MLAVQVHSVLLDFRFRVKSLSQLQNKQVKKTGSRAHEDTKYKNSSGVILGQALPF